mgnify:CR=1 FL=1
MTVLGPYLVKTKPFGAAVLFLTPIVLLTVAGGLSLRRRASPSRDAGNQPDAQGSAGCSGWFSAIRVKSGSGGARSTTTASAASAWSSSAATSGPRWPT